MRYRYPFSLALVAVLCGACFNPTLGEHPFLCAKEGKPCPDDYVCAPSRTVKNINICVPSGTQLDSGRPEAAIVSDGFGLPSKEGFVFIDGSHPRSAAGCADEASEPNNSAKTLTDLSKFVNVTLFPNWQICYAGDVDTYGTTLDEGDKLQVTVIFANSKGDIDAALFDPDGELLEAGRGTKDNETLSVTAAAKKGLYVIGVWGVDPTKTPTYDLEVKRTKR